MNNVPEPSLGADQGNNPQRDLVGYGMGGFETRPYGEERVQEGGLLLAETGDGDEIKGVIVSNRSTM